LVVCSDTLNALLPAPWLAKPRWLEFLLADFFGNVGPMLISSCQ
jgi:hypothetical protein